MSSHYYVQITNIIENKIELFVTMIHPDLNGFPLSKEFVFRLLSENDNLNNFKYEDMINEDFVKKNAEIYILEIKAERINNTPSNGEAIEKLIREKIKNLTQDQFLQIWNDVWQKRSGWREIIVAPAAHYKIKISNKTWLKNVKIGETWDSAAYASEKCLRLF